MSGFEATHGPHRGHQRLLGISFTVVIAATIAGQIGSQLLEQPAVSSIFVLLLVLAIGAVGLVGIALRPELGVLLLVALLTTNGSEIVVRALKVPSPMQLLTVAVATGLALRAWRNLNGKRVELVLDPLLLPLTIYVGVVFASSLVASDPTLSDQRLLEHLKGLLVFIVVTNAIRSREGLRNAVWAVVLAGAFLGSISLLQVTTGLFDSDFLGFGQVKVAQIVGELREPRIAGPLSDPNFYAQLLVAVFPLALALAWDERRPTPKLLAGYALLVIFAAAIFTYSRGGAVALALILLLALLSRRIRLRMLVGALVALSALLVIVPTNFTGRLSTLQQVIPGISSVAEEGADTSFRQRRLFMRAAWEMFEDHPLLGVGAGNYTKRYGDYSADLGSTLRSFDKFGGPYYPHSTPVEILAETGLLGFFAFGAVVLMAFASLTRAFRSFTRSGLQTEADLAIAVGLGLIGYLTTSLLLHAHHVHTFWLLVTLAGAARQVSKLPPRRGAS